MEYGILVEKYLAGPEILRRSISGMSDEQLNAAPIPFKWSTRQVVLHVADFDLIYADHMKRVIAETEPQLFGGNEKMYSSRLAYDKRDVDEEVRMIKAVRRHMEHGPITLARLLRHAAEHLPHHAQYIEEKRRALNIGGRAIPFHLASAEVMERAIA